jgi:hypothetical protein
MFEIGIFCVIFLAVAYWAVLWLMGRREDVLDGEFVKASRLPKSLCALYSRSGPRFETPCPRVPLKLVRSSRHSGSRF